MATVDVISYYANGYVVEHAPVDSSGNFTSSYCMSWLLLPAENLWPAWIRGLLYVIAIFYLFIGVAIGSDVFMTSIEAITSKKRTFVVWDEERGESTKKEVLIWNETVANLTLLALGSSAPEILISTVEAINELATGGGVNRGGLGFYTIIGSAAFNLLVITAICIVSVPSPDYKMIRDFGVFLLTSIWSLLAYVWLLVVLLWISPEVVEPWEAWVTLIFFPVLVLSAYAQDNGWWISSCRSKDSVSEVELPAEPPVINGFGSRRGSINYAVTLTPHSPEKLEVNKWQSTDPSHVNGRIIHSPKKISKGVTINDPRAIEMMSVKKVDPMYDVASVQPSQHEEPQYRPFARARFRHAAIRALGGTRRTVPLDHTQQDVVKSLPSEPKLLSIVSKIAAIRRLYSNSNAIRDESSGNLSFASSTYSVLESAGNLSVDVLLHRRKLPKGQTVIPTTNKDGKFDTEVVSGAVSVDYETREGTAKINSDFKYTSGTLIFTEEDYVKTISVPIINDDQYFPDTDFYIILKNAGGDATLGDPSVTRVTIIDDDKPGDFVLETSQLYADMTKGEVNATVLRQMGSDGNVSVHYATIDGTAIGGAEDDENADYVTTGGILEFKHNQTSKTITVKLNKEVKGTKNFVIVLRNPSQGSHLGEHSAAVCNINLQAGGLNMLSRVIVEEEDSSWTGQFKNAVVVCGDIDEFGIESPPKGIDYFLHFISLPWKLFFAIVPTRNVWGGGPAFLISLSFIGGITAFIEQLGHLLGCVAGLRTQVTGLTIIALGTSLPDTIASRTAALQEDYADASIGNITGSNSVNVFLGLGLPWVIRTMYFMARGGGEYRVNTQSLEFSVTLFASIGLVCIIILVCRRFFLGGELGGSKSTKWAFGGLLFFLWISFIVVASFKAYEYF